MIPILYASNATTFNNFGIGHLTDAISPHVVEERNGEFTFEMQYPIDGEHFSEIQMRSIIKAKPSPAQDPQAFRVFRITKPINGIVTVSARHVRYDLEGVPVSPFTAQSITAALQAISDNSLVTNPFTFTTDKTNTQTLTLEAPSSALSLLGGVRGSLLDIYGGEYKYDDFEVSLLSIRGEDKGVVIRYGVDLIDLQQEENCANVYTGVMCFWKSAQDGTVVTGQIQSSGTFDFTRVLVIDKTTDYESTPTVAQLNQDAVRYINNNKVGVPKVSLNVRFANLEQTEEYANIRRSVELCDLITVEFERLGVSATAKIYRTDFDVINEKYISVEIGDTRTSLADSFVAVQTRAESAPTTAEMQQVIEATTAAITGANGGAVRLLDTNSDGLPDTLYIADNISPLLAQKVWRFNYEGWGASQNGYSGPFTMGATFAQGFLAEFITAGYLSADRIRANSITVGKLTGSISNSGWEINLTNGTMTIGSLSVGKITGNIQNGGWGLDFDHGTFNIGTLNANKISGGTIDASQVTVTNLNASNIRSGTLSVDRIGSNSIGIGKLSGSISKDNWEINLTSGTMTIGKISANNITAGTIDASQITVTNLNADNITTGSINGQRITNGTIGGAKLSDYAVSEDKLAALSISSAKLQDYAVTGNKLDDLSVSGAKIQNSAVTNSKISNLTITGSKIADTTLPGDKLVNHTLNDLQISGNSLSTASLSGGINRSLGYADFSNDVFNNATRCAFLYCDYLDVGTTGRIDGFSARSLSVYYGGSYYSATFQTPSVDLTHSSAFQVLDTNGNTQWVSNVTAASLGQYVLAH